MRMALIALAAVAFMVMLPMAQAGEADTRCSGAPCGRINPILNLEVPDKKDCGAGLVLGVAASASDCMSPPLEGQPVQLPATLEWYWDVTNDATYPNDPTQPIEISFGAGSRNPSWIDFSVEPDTFTLNTPELFDPRHFVVEDNSGSPQLWFRFERDVTITFTRTGDPTPEELDSIRANDGLAPLFVKMHSTASSERFAESYGIEEFRFHIANDPELASELSKGTPAPGLLPAVGVLAVVVVARRVMQRR